jgi:hypothetical protein
MACYIQRCPSTGDALILQKRFVTVYIFYDNPVCFRDIDEVEIGLYIVWLLHSRTHICVTYLFTKKRNVALGYYINIYFHWSTYFKYDCFIKIHNYTNKHQLITWRWSIMLCVCFCVCTTGVILTFCKRVWYYKSLS